MKLFRFVLAGLAVVGVSSITNPPTTSPTAQPSSSPSSSPSNQPSSSPSSSPSTQPSNSPSSSPSNQPSSSPSAEPSNSPSSLPSGQPSSSPSAQPSGIPSAQPSGQPSSSPSAQPSGIPSAQPSGIPSAQPTLSHEPSVSKEPSDMPSASPSIRPSPTCDAPSIGCGFGMFNVHLCQCQCLSPFSPDATGACFQGGSSITNAFSGCTLDCPWFADPLTQTCVFSDEVPSGISKIYLAKGRCCRNEFSSTSAACIASEVTFANSAFQSYWYPDWAGNTNVCLNDGGQPMYMNMNPAAFLYLSPLECCSAYFGWTYGSCVEAALSAITQFVSTDFSDAHTLTFEGTLELDAAFCATVSPTSSATTVSADSAAMIMANATFAELCKDFCKPGDSITVTSVCGEATTEGSQVFTQEQFATRRRLQGQNAYHYILTVRTPTEDDAGILLKILNSQLAMASTLTAIQAHMNTWGLTNVVVTGFTALNFFILNNAGTVVRSRVFYPDWGNTETCIADGNEPEYMRANPTQWVFTTLDGCCTRYYSWNMAACAASGTNTTLGGTSSAVNATQLWFPDWQNIGTTRCLQDTNTTNPPEYMVNNPNAWLRATANDCCERYFGYNLPGCLVNAGAQNTTSAAAAGSDAWYVNWVDFQCVKDCTVNATEPDCGGLKNVWDTGYASAAVCCQTKLGWRNATTCTPTGPP